MSRHVPAIAPAKIAVLAAALAILLSGCALEPAVRAAGRSASPCGVGAILYCEVDFQLHIESCHCARRGDLRSALRNLARR